MPGSVSDSYDPEWGTSANGDRIREVLQIMYSRVSSILGNKPPIYVLALLEEDLNKAITATMTEREWRLIRFALERAMESI
jgi:hypothetical protein